ncbi:ABC transporter substrate-binding protein [Fodinicurvata halophila]|uniref:ABC transporter substrate-binding protein n=1 Tax=Fodinicurvata halophila TaxID=1419723 RepID=A0ABV8UHI6_9PROT
MWKPKTRFCLSAAVFGVLAIGSGAQAADELVIATFGGSFGDATEKCHIAPFEEETGAEVIMTLGSSVDNAAKIRATAGNPEIDLAYMDIEIAKQMEAEGLLESLDFESLENYDGVDPNVFNEDGHFANFMTSATVIAYNPDEVDSPPTSWSDLFDPKYEGKIALGDITGTSGLHFLLAVNRMKDGDFESQDAGFEAIEDLMPHVVTLYTQADQLVELFQRGEIVMAPWYPDRAGSAADKGVNVAVSYPEEGAVGIRPTVSVPEGAANKDLALQYMDVLFSKEGQECFAENMYAAPVRMDVDLSEKVQAVLPSSEDYEKLWYPDTDVTSELRPEWTQRWQREIAN